MYLKQTARAMLVLLYVSFIVTINVIVSGCTTATPVIVADAQPCSGSINLSQVKVDLAGRDLNLDENQAKLLRLAYSIGKETGLPGTTQGILLAETEAGKLSKVGDGGKSLGEMQTQLHACRIVLKHYPHLGKFTDNQLKSRLLNDSEFAIRMGAYYLKILHDNYASIKNENKRWRAAVLCYNAGPDNVRIGRDPQKYLKRVNRFMTKVVKPFNKQAELS